ncbi:MAG: hypothetical protein AAF587_36610 [Bacteroidota bacterium]
MGTIDTYTNTQVGSAVSPPFQVAHNVIPNCKNTKLFVTHSGATNDKVTIYNLDPIPTHSTSLVVGLNPFGLGYYRYR